MDEGSYKGGGEAEKALVPSAPPTPAKEAPHKQKILCAGSQRQSSLRGREVTFIIANLTVGPDGCGGWAIYVGWGGASQEEAPTNCGRQSPPEGIPPGW